MTKRKKILIVEDEKIVVLDLRSILTAAGYLVVGDVATGKQAISASETLSPDIILMDIALRGSMSGIDAASSILRTHDIPIVFLTANSDEKTLKQARQTDAYGYILKPFDERDVRTTLDLALYKHQSQKELKHQQQWLATILKSIGDGVIVTDTKGIVTFTNTVAAELTGWDSEETVGRKFTDVYAIEDEKSGKKIHRRVERVLKSRKTITSEQQSILISRKGKRTFIEDSASPIVSYEGLVTGVVVTFRDVSDKRKSQEEVRNSEKRFRALIEKSSEAVSIIDSGGRIQYTTTSTASILGYRTTDYIDKRLSDFIAPEDRKYEKERMQEILRNPGKSMMSEFRMKHRNGTWKWIDATFTNLLGDPAVNGIVMNFRDNTFRKESERNMNHLNRRLDLIARVTSEVIGSLPIQQQAQAMIEQVKAAFDVDIVIIRVTDDEQLHLLASIGVDSSRLAERIPSTLGIAKKMMSSRRALWIKDVNESYTTQQQKNKAGLPVNAFTMTSYAGAPLLIGHTVIGIIGLYTVNNVKEFTTTDLEHLQIVANHISVAIANEQLFIEIRQQNVEMTKHIEEQGRTEKLLRDSEERYRELVEHSPVAIFIHVNGVIRFVNSATLTLFGANTDAVLIGKQLLDFIHPDYRESAIQRIKKVYAKEKQPTVEQKYLRIDGTPIDVEISSIPFTYDGNPAAQVIARDITERKQQEVALLESELRFRSLFENAKDAVFLTDTKTMLLIDVNAEAEKLLKRSRVELIGKHQTYIHPKELSEKAEDLFQEQLLILGEQPVEFEVVDSTGKRIPVEIKASIVRLDDDRIMLQGIYRDISERKLSEQALRDSEEKYRRLFEDSKDGIYITTIDGSIIDVNSSMMEILGFHNKEELKQKNVNDFYFYPSDRAKFIAQFGQKDFVKDFEVVLRKKDNTKVHILLTTVVIRDDSGTPILFNGSMRDITEKKHLEQQLMQSQKMESIGTLAGGIAHDFNNLLAMILGTAELMKRTVKDNAQIQSYVNMIIEASERGSSISRQLLLFSRPEQAELRPIAVHDVINQVTEFLTHFLPKTIDVRREEEQSSSMILGDMGHLHQVILNLAINARDAMPNGGTISVSARTVAGNLVKQKFPSAELREYAAISVSDTGMGIDEEIQQRIFEPFFSTKSRGKGTGLGLSIVHGIVHLHQGFIDVNSQKGIGTTFTMYYPAMVANTGVESQTETAMEKTNTETIMVVDDEDMLREILVENLQFEGFSVIAAGDGVEALQLYQKQIDSIDLVITDLGMPKMGGEELFENLYKINPAVKVIVSSGFLDNSTRSELLRKGIKDVLTKPYKFEQILSTVRKVLENVEP